MPFPFTSIVLKLVVKGASFGRTLALLKKVFFCLKSNLSNDEFGGVGEWSRAGECVSSLSLFIERFLSYLRATSAAPFQVIEDNCSLSSHTLNEHRLCNMNQYFVHVEICADTTAPFTRRVGIWLTAALLSALNCVPC